MKIYFKEVGQGDSIILEWENAGQMKIAIIDCNVKAGRVNPSLLHLQSAQTKSIEFILLTHPHFDHFSGLNEILNYCDSAGIIIKYFLHTCQQLPEFLRSAVKGNVARSELDKLWQKILFLLNKGIIQNEFFVQDTSRHLELGEGWILTFLAPSSKEYREFIRKKYTADLETKINSSIANYLSTLVKISKDGKHILLTSDVVKSVFRRIVRDGLKVVRTEVVLGQVPHHGALDNYHEKFWSLQPHRNDVPIAFSVGENDYGHPDNYVINSLLKNKFFSCFTNTPEYSNSGSLPHIYEDLDLISTMVSDPPVGFKNPQELIFDFN